MIRNLFYSLLLISSTCLAQIDASVTSVSDLSINKDITEEQIKAEKLSTQLLEQKNVLQNAESLKDNLENRLKVSQIKVKQIKSQLKIAEQNQKIAKKQLKEATKANGKNNVYAENTALTQATTNYNEIKSALIIAESAEKNDKIAYNSAKDKAKNQKSLLKHIEKEKKAADKNLKTAQNRINTIESHSNNIQKIERKIEKLQTKIQKQQTSLSKAGSDTNSVEIINQKIQKFEVEKQKLLNDKQNILEKLKAYENIQ